MSVTIRSTSNIRSTEIIISVSLAYESSTEIIISVSLAYEMQHIFSTRKAWYTLAIITRIYKAFCSISKQSVRVGKRREKNLQCKMTDVGVWGRSLQRHGGLERLTIFTIF